MLGDRGQRVAGESVAEQPIEVLAGWAVGHGA